jgi:hypothetical protein
MAAITWKKKRPAAVPVDAIRQAGKVGSAGFKLGCEIDELPD